MIGRSPSCRGFSMMTSLRENGVICSWDARYLLVTPPTALKENMLPQTYQCWIYINFNIKRVWFLSSIRMVIYSNPKCSMYGIFTYIYPKFKPNVGMVYHGASWASFSRHSVNTRWTFATEKQPELPKRILTCSCWRVSSDPSDLSLPGGRDLVTKFMAGESWESMKNDVDKMNYPLFKPSKDPNKKSWTKQTSAISTKKCPRHSIGPSEMDLPGHHNHHRPSESAATILQSEALGDLWLPKRYVWWKNPAKHLGCQK